MSHGVKRARQSAEVLQARRQKELSQLNAYLTLTDDVFAKKKAGDLSREAFDATSKLLSLNPELYTMWNYRRTLLLKGLFPDLPPAKVHALLLAELALTTAALRQHPKVYWIWNHRRWCLENVPDGPEDAPPSKSWREEVWGREMYIVEKMLDVDPRNFHAWGYRRYVLASLPGIRSPQEELAYTKRKIESNFSNFSAWHQRSKVYTALWDKGVTVEEQRKVKDSEFDLIKQAMYTDPADQSVWLYHRWLIGKGDERHVLEREISSIEELLSIEPDSKWCLESLVHYKGLLVAHLPTTDIQGSAALRKQCNEMLSRLQAVDPKRRQRYKDMSYPS